MTIKYLDVPYARIPGFRPLLLDLFVPAAEQPVPVVAFVHGGGFSTGSHKAEHYSLVQEVTEALTERGIAVAAVQYRLSGEAQFPAPLHDVKGAIRWLRLHAAEHHLNGDRIGAFGDSAGGYFSAMLATTADIEALDGDIPTGATTSTRISAAVSWFGPTHLASQPAIGPGFFGSDPAQSPESRFLGATVATVPDLAEWASPVTHVTAAAAPILLVHGTDDDGVPHQQSERLHAAYAAGGAQSELILVPGGHHGFRNVDAKALMQVSADYLATHLFDGV